MKLKYIPNILSAIRLMLVPVFIYLFFAYYKEKIYIPLCVFVIAGLTDIIDGYLARRNNWITNLGKFLDPLADKLLQCSVLVCFVIINVVPWWLAGMFILKELFMICGALIVLKKIKVTVRSHWYGKFTTAVFYAIALLVFIFKIFEFEMGGPVAVSLFISALILALFSMVMYILDTLRINAELQKGKEKEEKVK
ncbi:MAG: CDP-alcohol phosphatidyltransferase family protein [Oscillospiraceae bacterium]|nr:CDP-alcohol phosphatidyltransferase family protein [Oscillospiraceae bacterium]